MRGTERGGACVVGGKTSGARPAPYSPAAKCSHKPRENTEKVVEFRCGSGRDRRTVEIAQQGDLAAVVQRREGCRDGRCERTTRAGTDGASARQEQGWKAKRRLSRGCGAAISGVWKCWCVCSIAHPQGCFPARTHEQVIAEDVVRAAFLRAYEWIERFAATRPFGPWFLWCVANGALATVTRRRHSTLDADAMANRRYGRRPGGTASPQWSPRTPVAGGAGSPCHRTRSSAGSPCDSGSATRRYGPTCAGSRTSSASTPASARRWSPPRGSGACSTPLALLPDRRFSSTEQRHEQPGMGANGAGRHKRQPRLVYAHKRRARSVDRARRAAGDRRSGGGLATPRYPTGRSPSRPRAAG